MLLALPPLGPAVAEATIERLSDVLRWTLERTTAPMGTLGDEMDYLEAYLTIERQRFGERLGVEWPIAPPGYDVERPSITNASSRSARDFSSDAITVSRSVTDSMPR